MKLVQPGTTARASKPSKSDEPIIAEVGVRPRSSHLT